MVIYFIYTHDLIQKGVKAETSYLVGLKKQQTEDPEIGRAHV